MDFICALMTLLWLTAITASDEGLREYCPYENFNVTCPDEHVILIEQAKYGRMRLGKCLTTDVYIGCSSSVLPVFDSLCSGRKSCLVEVTSDDLHKRTPCPLDMMLYLEASYTCIRAVSNSPSEEKCDESTGVIALNEASGYLVTSQEPSQSSGCYWRIIVQKGQKIVVDLFDFALRTSYSYDKPIDAMPEIQYCQVYAEIREKDTARTQTICAATERETRVYSSVTHAIEIFVNAVNSPSGAGDSPKFMFKYQAVGCPDIPAPEGGRVIRDGDKATLRCNHTIQTSHLICRGTEWVGKLHECDDKHSQGRHRSDPGDFPTYGLLVAVIIGVVIGIVCGFSMLATVLWCRRRKTRRRPLNRHTEMELLPPSEDTGTSNRCKVQRLKGEYGLTHVWEVQNDDGTRFLHTHPISGTGSMSPDSAYLTYQGASTVGASSIGTYPGPTGSSVSGSGSGRIGTLPPERSRGRDPVYESPRLLPDGSRVPASPLPCCRQFVEPPKGPLAVGTPMVPTTATCATPPPPPKTSNTRIESTEVSDETDDDDTLNKQTQSKGYKLVPGSPDGPPAAPPRQRNENHYT